MTTRWGRALGQRSAGEGYGPSRESAASMFSMGGRRPYPPGPVLPSGSGPDPRVVAARPPAATQASQAARGAWPEVPALSGGNWHGRPPRGAGVIAFRSVQEEGADAESEASVYVCLVESSSKKLSFPKGGKKFSDGSVLDCAYRELLEETGIRQDRLNLYTGLHVDEDRFGCRYILAEVSCQRSDLDFEITDSGWAPPHEDPTDKDPVVRAHWAPLRAVLAGQWAGLHPGRVQMLRDAVRLRRDRTR
eukprot:s1904_g2.t1